LASALVVYDKRQISFQVVVRRDLALRRALTRMLALVILQKHLRGYLAKRDIKAARKAAIAVQRVYRGGTAVGAVLCHGNSAPCSWIAAFLYVLEQVTMITMVRACVRRMQAMDTAMNRMVTVMHIQSIFRVAFVRSRQGWTVAAATKVQTAWRCFSGRFNLQSECLASSSHCSKCSSWFCVCETRKVSLDDPECAVVVRLHDE
jgi:hypothetical protein